MTETLINEAVKSGIWAVLFVTLLIYVIRENKARESEYQTIIKQLNCEIIGKANDNQRVVGEVNITVDKIETKLQGIETKVEELDKKVDQVIEKADIIDRRMCDEY